MSFSLSQKPLIYTSDGYGTWDKFSLVTGGTDLSTIPLASNLGVAAAEALLLGFLVTNQTGSTIYAGVYDGYAEPAAHKVPILEVKLTANAQVSLDCSSFNCIPCKKGIVVAASSVSGSYTGVSSAMFLTAFWTRA